MARICGKTAQLLWFCGSSITLTTRSFVPTFRRFELKDGSILLPRAQEFYCLHRTTMSNTNTTSSPPRIQVREKISLTDKEKQIFDHLLQVLRHFDLQTQLRVAGGWVRDKLLGKECYDIDIALDNMLGREFCEKVNDYLLSTGEQAHGIGVIQCNPDQSKHLETANMRIFGVSIDFVNLRAEDYTENSRIPTMRFGTPEEDAYRRDLTINSLFYNINTSSVEDFTGRGIEDLKSGKIVTPLPPVETFLDDPLRVLRAIRFGARFEFDMDEGLKAAAAQGDVRHAISDKISRERIGHEIDLMISGNQPVKAMAYITELRLFWVVFAVPSKAIPPISEEHDKVCIGYMDAAWRIMQMIGCSTFGDEQRRLYLYAALFLPFRKTSYKDNKGKTQPVVGYIFRDSLKLKSSYAETVGRLHKAVEQLLSLFPFINASESTLDVKVDWKKETIDVPSPSKLRILAGLVLREIKDLWRAALLLATLLYPTEIYCSSDSSLENIDILRERVEWFKSVEQVIVGLDLEKVWEVKPLVNGKEIMSILQLKTGGPMVSEWQQKVLQWQLAHPSWGADECKEWMMTQAQSKRAKTQ